MILLWLAERATDTGVCFPASARSDRRTGLSERMVRYYLHWLAGDHDDEASQGPSCGSSSAVAGDRNTSNVYVLRVPWAGPEVVRASSRN